MPGPVRKRRSIDPEPWILSGNVDENPPSNSTNNARGQCGQSNQNNSSLCRDSSASSDLISDDEDSQKRMLRRRWVDVPVLSPSEHMEYDEEQRYLTDHELVHTKKIFNQGEFDCLICVDDEENGLAFERSFIKEALTNQSPYFQKHLSSGCHYFLSKTNETTYQMRIRVEKLTPILLYNLEQILYDVENRDSVFSTFSVKFAFTVLKFFADFHFVFLKRELLRFLKEREMGHALAMCMALGLTHEINVSISEVKSIKELTYLLNNSDSIFDNKGKILTNNQIISLLTKVDVARLEKMNIIDSKLGHRLNQFIDPAPSCIRYWKTRVRDHSLEQRERKEAIRTLEPISYEHQTAIFDIRLQTAEIRCDNMEFDYSWFSRKTLVDKFRELRFPLTHYTEDPESQGFFIGYIKLSSFRYILDVILEREKLVPALDLFQILDIVEFSRKYSMHCIQDFAKKRSIRNLGSEAYLALCYYLYWPDEKAKAIKNIEESFSISKFLTYLRWLIGTEHKCITMEELNYILHNGKYLL